MTLEYVDLETAKAATGTRLVVSSLVPSPWSEAMKGLFLLAGLPAVVVRRTAEVAAVDAWTGIDNVPALMHEREPLRTTWSQIVAFVDRMAPARGLLPAGVAARAEAMGVIDTIAGEGGIGWNARLAMIEAGLRTEGVEGFPPAVSKRLGRRYGYSPGAVAAARERMPAQFELVASRLAGRPYFGGERPDAIDVYSATFLTPIAAPISEADCPALIPMLRTAFASAHTAFGAMVPPALVEHRARMFGTHLPWPILL